MKIRNSIIVIVLIVAVVWFGWNRMSNGKPSPQGTMGTPPRVIVQLPQTQDVEEFYEFTGNTASVEQVEICARVEGVLKTVDFADGADVNEGDLLFTIEPDAYIARRDQAQAQLEASQANLARTQLDYERMEKAVQVNAVSKQDLTTAKAQRDQAQAGMMAAAADLQTAKLNLSYTRITSPIAGRVGRRLVDAGNLVGAGEQTLLTTVVKLQPLYVYFNAGEDILNQYFITHQLDTLKKDLPKFQVGFAGRDDYPHEGVLDYIDNKVDQTTGTISVRGRIPNAERRLFPGTFVRIRVPTGVMKDAILVQERAIQSDLGGKYVLTVDAQNIVQYHRVRLGRKIGDKIVVKSGLNSDERYVLSGFHLARPGAPVTPAAEESQDKAPSEVKSETTPKS
jgi:RND family efflux transporter MFP subunit